MMPAERKSKRVAMIVHRVGPYHFARARAAGKILTTTLVEMFKGDDIYKWDMVSGSDGFERLTLFATQPKSTRVVTEGLCAALDHCQPDAVAVPGWADAVALGAMKWCRSRQIPAIVMSESTEWDEPRKPWKEWIKRRFLSMAAAGFVGGQPHAEYMTKLGVPNDRVFEGYDAVDNDYFAGEAAKWQKLKAETLKSDNEDRAANGSTQSSAISHLPSSPFFLASARFVEKKNLLRLIQAYARYRTLAENAKRLKSETLELGLWDLVLLGDGPLNAAINSQLSNLKLAGHIHLPGFKQYDELPAYYGLASAFIHASTTEQWGLVVNEAMASGLPVLVSNRCGCAQDLVQEGVNGFTFDPYDVEQMAQLMFRFSAFPSLKLSEFGSASQRIIAEWGPERFAKGMCEAVNMALSVSPPRASVFDRLLLKLLLMK